MKKIQTILFFIAFFGVSGVSQTPSLKDIYFFSLYGFGVGSIVGEDILVYAPNTSIKYTATDIEFDDRGNEKSKETENKYLFFYDNNAFGYSDGIGVHKFFRKAVISESGYILFVYDTKGILIQSEKFFFKEFSNTLEILSEYALHEEQRIKNEQISYLRDKIIQHENEYEIYHFDGNNLCLMYKLYFEENIPTRIDTYTERSVDEPERIAYSSFYDNGGKVVLRIEYDETGEIKREKKYTYNPSVGEKLVSSTDSDYVFKWYYKEDSAGHIIYERHEYDSDVSIKTILPCDTEGNVLYSVDDLAVEPAKNTKTNPLAVLKYRALILIGIGVLVILPIVLVLLRKRKKK